MSNYTKQISWSGKDALSDSDSEKVISGGDFDTEFSAVQTAINSKIDGGTITNFTSTGIDDNATSTAITIDSAEHVSLAHGIGFNGDTAAANALDDYEEGTFTPVYVASGGTFTNSGSVGYYTKIGNRVHITGHMRGGMTASTGNVSITGLPFTTSASPTYGHSGYVGGASNFLGDRPTSIWLAPNDTFMYPRYQGVLSADNTTFSVIQGEDLSTTLTYNILEFSATYLVD